MSRPRKTCRESAEMISAAMPSSRSAEATAIETPVLPVAVGPAITRSGGLDPAPSGMRRGDSSKRVRPGVLDPDVNGEAEPGRRTRQVHELVLARPSREVHGFTHGPVVRRGA